MARSPLSSRLVRCLLLAFGVSHTYGLRRHLRNLPQSEQPYYFFMAHHKTGTALVNHICDHMKKAVTGSPELCARCQHVINATSNGTWCFHIWSDGKSKNRWPEFYNNSNHFFGGTPLEEVVSKAGDNYRAVHVIRDPLTTFASAYIYDQKGVDHTGAGKKELEGLSLKDGLRLKAKDVKALTEEMRRAHKVALQHPQVVEVRYEDFKGAYDDTAGKIFSFVTDSDVEDQKPLFLNLASKDDQNRWHPNRFNQNHVSDPNQEREVVAALRELCAEGDEAVTVALAPRADMGYGEKCPGPESA